MKKFIISMLIVCGASINAQNSYIDLTTTLALNSYSNSIKEEQEKQTIEQTKLQQAQAYVASQMVHVNWIQNKIFTGLTEVSGALTNGIQVKRMISNLDDCRRYITEIGELSYNHPTYAAFGAEASKKAYHFVLDSTTEISQLLQPGELNLATAGDRYRLLDRLGDKIISLKIRLLTIKLAIERAKRMGFWNAINPFQAYINTDKDIIRNIMDNYKHNF